MELIATERLEEKPKKTYCKKIMLEKSPDPLHWPGISLTPQSGLWVVPLALVMPVVSSCKDVNGSKTSVKMFGGFLGLTLLFSL